MHELSLAGSILELALRHVPPGAALTRVRVAAGPMRAIEPEAMQFAWDAVLRDGGLDRIPLDLDLRPWTLRCPECGRQWTSDSLDRPCACGGLRPYPVGGDELQLISIEVEEPAARSAAEPGVNPCASRLSKMC